MRGATEGADLLPLLFLEKKGGGEHHRGTVSAHTAESVTLRAAQHRNESPWAAVSPPPLQVLKQAPGIYDGCFGRHPSEGQSRGWIRCRVTGCLDFPKTRVEVLFLRTSGRAVFEDEIFKEVMEFK